MEELLKLNAEDISRSIKPTSLRQLQIIQLALVAGTVLFFVICMVLHLLGEDLPTDGPELELITLPVLGLMFLGAVVAASFLPAVILKPDALAGRAAGMTGDPVEWALSIYRTVLIVRMALLEGAALFGLVILMMAVLSKQLSQRPIMWLSTVPLLVYAGCGIFMYPSKSAVVEFIDARIVKPLRRRSDSIPGEPQ